MTITRALLLALLFALPALAQEAGEEGSEEGSTSGSDIDVDALMKSIDLGPAGGGGNEVTYEGRLSSSAPNFALGKPVTITHSGGTISINCMDAPGITARLGYTIYGTNQPNMEKYGKGIGLSSFGDSNGGNVKTRIPAKLAGINRADIPLTVNLPLEAKVTVVGGAGWVQIIDCKGTVKSSNGDGGAYVSGTYSNVNVSATRGDVKVELTDASTLTGVNAINAPGGNAVLRLPLSYAGKFAAKGESVSVFHTVMGGVNSSNAVTGTIGTGTASVSVSAKGSVEVTAPK